jgi:hypothetical protein
MLERIVMGHLEGGLHLLAGWQGVPSAEGCRLAEGCLLWVLWVVLPGGRPVLLLPGGRPVFRLQEGGGRPYAHAMMQTGRAAENRNCSEQKCSVGSIPLQVH